MFVLSVVLYHRIGPIVLFDRIVPGDTNVHECTWARGYKRVQGYNHSVDKITQAQTHPSNNHAHHTALATQHRNREARVVVEALLTRYHKP